MIASQQPWIFLLLAGGFEIASSTIYRYTDGLSRPGPTALLLAAGIASLYLLNRAMSGPTGIPIGTAYAVWTGLGAAGTALIGIAIYQEPANLARVALLALLIFSIVGLKFIDPH